MAVARVNTTKSAGVSTTGVVAYPASLAAGDLLLLTLYDQGALNAGQPALFTSVGAAVSVSGLLLHFFWKLAVGGESGNLSFTFSGSNNYIAFLTRYTGLGFTQSSFLNYATITGSNTSIISAPNQGNVAAGQVGWSTAGAYNGTHGANTVTGAGWAIDQQQNIGSPNIEAICAASTTALGACQFRFVNTYVELIAASFRIAEAFDAPQPLMFCEV